VDRHRNPLAGRGGDRGDRADLPDRGNLFIPDTGARYPHQEHNPIRLFGDFGRCCATLWRDKLGQISLAVTTLFWGVGAVLQFIVLKWAEDQLGMPLSQAAVLQGIVAIGIALGAVLAARIVPLRGSLRVLPVGLALGVVLPVMTLINSVGPALPVLVAIGAMAGFFVVPMNALLQHRGHVLMSAGHSIAVQNFNENLNILLMLGVYALLIRLQLPIGFVILFFSVLVSGVMVLIIRHHRANQRRFDSISLIGARHTGVPPHH
jgi:MFS transporter, LPLT family, lysophospholipid transporter